ncbi:2,3-dihydro-2,3-dihydroxybenzoate dehydrogenase [Vibrio spartinae]|uniref:2,3-dihydro-2,3-dihydroxybenzoate dehydrogenase n=1 Tax=Vibrio spartinae TaxID=1918945 RepID=A0ABX6QY34_9VIBR|nr:2,3-dihydro-2,3-dihydroxybenzoate dehydrogenase [Vibrio spartinae]QMV14164.1 2,3-dihydro-2,3-dihydroxybenzoate dehydrogenase [Vibrio spartinae]
MKQNNETVLLTGASQGIGYAVLERLLAEGYKVVATDRCMDALESKLGDFKRAYGEQLDWYAIDLLDRQLAQQVAQLCREYHFDHFVSCAGVLNIGNVHAMAAEDIRQMFDINTFGALTMIQHVAEGMKHRQSGSIVVIGSNSANTPRLNIGAYAASKSALQMLVKCTALELAEYGIRCNIVSPGSTRTEMQTQLWHDNYGEQQVIEGNLEQYRLGIPLKTMAEPVDIANAVLFLMSDSARQITMHDLRVDGGATLDN